MWLKSMRLTEPGSNHCDRGSRKRDSLTFRNSDQCQIFESLVLCRFQEIHKTRTNVGWNGRAIEQNFRKLFFGSGLKAPATRLEPMPPHLSIGLTQLPYMKLLDIRLFILSGRKLWFDFGTATFILDVNAMMVCPVRITSLTRINGSP